MINECPPNMHSSKLPPVCIGGFVFLRFSAFVAAYYISRGNPGITFSAFPDCVSNPHEACYARDGAELRWSGIRLMLLSIVAFGVKVNSGKGPREQNRTIIHEIEARVQSMDNLEETGPTNLCQATPATGRLTRQPCARS